MTQKQKFIQIIEGLLEIATPGSVKDSLWQAYQQIKADQPQEHKSEGGFSLSFASTNGGAELLFGLNPASRQQTLIVGIGKERSTLDNEDTQFVLSWLQAHQEDIP